MGPVFHTHRIGLVLHEDDRVKIELLARAEKKTMSAWVRDVIRAEITRQTKKKEPANA